MKKALVAAAAMALGLAALAGCSSDDDKGSSTSSTQAGSSKEAVCDARTQLANKIKSFNDPSLLLEGKSGIQSALNSVEKDVNNLTDAAKDDYQPQVDDVKESLDDLKSAVGDIGERLDPEQPDGDRERTEKAGTSTQALLDQVNADCP